MERDELVAPFRLEYTYKRSTGPVIGRFLTSLRDGRLEGVRTTAGAVLVPARAYDPRTGEATTDDWVDVGPEGVVVTATDGWALVTLDGADTPWLHRALGPVAIGDRVRAVFADERVGSITDLAGFERVP